MLNALRMFFNHSSSQVDFQVGFEKYNQIFLDIYVSFECDFYVFFRRKMLRICYG